VGVTHHECVVLELVSIVEMMDDVLTELVRHTPGHARTHGTYLQQDKMNILLLVLQLHTIAFILEGLSFSPDMPLSHQTRLSLLADMPPSPDTPSSSDTTPLPGYFISQHYHASNIMTTIAVELTSSNRYRNTVNTGDHILSGWVLVFLQNTRTQLVQTV